MGTIKWLTFCLFPPRARTLVHFLPLATTVRVPFPAVCRMTLFGDEGEKHSVFLEGASVSQPDGVWVDEVFGGKVANPETPKGLVVELISSKKILDLSVSACIIEFTSKTGSVKFRPRLQRSTADREEDSKSSSVPVFSDNFNESSLVIVNSGNQESSLVCRGAEELMSHLIEKVDPIVPPESVVEIDLPVPKSLIREKGGGYIHLPTEALGSDVAHYMLYRDSRLATPVSVCAL